MNYLVDYATQNGALLAIAFVAVVLAVALWRELLTRDDQVRRLRQQITVLERELETLYDQMRSAKPMDPSELMLPPLTVVQEPDEASAPPVNRVVPIMSPELRAILAEPVRTTALPHATPTPQLGATSTPAAVPPGSPTLLVDHCCRRCGHAMKTPTNSPATTVDCPACQQRTDVFAIQFKCMCGLLLEAPARVEGQHPCPKCKRGVTVPSLVLLEKPRWPNDPDYFACKCPSCSKRLIVRREEVGKDGVCPGCRAVITVPNYGEALTDTRAPLVVDHRGATQTERLVPCQNCADRIPANALSCRRCGTQNRRSAYPTG